MPRRVFCLLGLAAMGTMASPAYRGRAAASRGDPRDRPSGRRGQPALGSDRGAALCGL